MMSHESDILVADFNIEVRNTAGFVMLVSHDLPEM